MQYSFSRICWYIGFLVDFTERWLNLPWPPLRRHFVRKSSAKTSVIALSSYLFILEWTKRVWTPALGVYLWGTYSLSGCPRHVGRNYVPLLFGVGTIKCRLTLLRNTWLLFKYCGVIRICITVIPPLPPSLVTQQIHCPFQPKQSPSSKIRLFRL